MASSSSSSSGAAAARFLSCFNRWLAQQETDLNNLLQALDTNANDTFLTSLVARIINNFEDYAARRRVLAPENPSAFFTPTWCSPFEKSFLWLGGCRPSLAIRLVYSQSSSDLMARIDEFFAGGIDAAESGGLLGLGPEQSDLLQDLQGRTVVEEDRMSSKMALLQEDVADDPLLPIVRQRGELVTANGGYCQYPAWINNMQVISAAMEKYMQKLAKMMEEADRLRIRSLREIVMDRDSDTKAGGGVAGGGEAAAPRYPCMGPEQRQGDGTIVMFN